MPAFSRFLRYFLVVGRLGSIRKAADELNVSASAIDRQILNAEALLGMPLFERLPTGLRLTAAGEIMMAAGGRWTKSLATVRAQIEDLKGLKRGHVEIAIISALTRGYVPDTLARLHTRYPGITVGVTVCESELIRDRIVNADVDFGIFFEPESYRDLTVRTFAEVDLGFVMLPDHPLAARDAVRYHACAGMPMIRPMPPLAVHQQVALLDGTAKVDANVVASSNNIAMMLSLVRQRVGIGILTSLDVQTEVATGELAFTRIIDPALRPMTLALCTATTRSPSYAADVVLTELQAGFAALGYQRPA